MSVPTVTLNDGHEIPQLGFGVFKIEDTDAERAVSDALEIGYRHIDTAAIYRNEAGVGRAIAASGIPRSELWVTTKVYNNDQGKKRTLDAVGRSLDKLGLERVDLYLIHWPSPAQDLYVETWRTLEEIRERGQATSIGVSNFLVPHLERIIAETGVVPAVDQIELHPYHQQPAVTGFAAKHDIAIEGWGPLGQGKYPLLELPEIVRVAAAHGKSAAQVVLRWHLQAGHIVFPKSTHRQRIAENFDLFDFELSEDEQAAITGLERAGRVGGDPNKS